MDTMVETTGVCVNFGGLQALEDVGVAVERGTTLGIIGPNGAGKTTFLNCISGIQHKDAGCVRLHGEDITTLPAHEIARRGVARTFQSPSLIRRATVLANVMLGQHLAMRSTALGNLFRTPRTRREERQTRKRAEESLAFLGLEAYRDVSADQLPHGLSKMTEVARAICQQPHVLLLDEPTSGMTSNEKEMIAELLRRIQSSFNVTQILIEHDVAFVRSLCDQLVVLDFGRVIAQGAPDDVLNNERVRLGYLGKIGSSALPPPPIQTNKH